MRRPWVPLADLVLSVALLSAAGMSLARGAWLEALLAVVLAAGWGVGATRRVGRRTRRAATSPALAAPPRPAERTGPTG